ncbi:aminoacyl-tRNA deacylase [Exilibacterium tricleocarpae]|nr:YbaK/EbsC family protein [Exilibacterium tricleocarpae]
MSLSPAVESYLSQSDIPFDVLEHPRSTTSMQTAHAAHVTPAQLAKAVVVRDQDRYMMCVLPASHILVMNWVDTDYKGHYRLATEDELAKLFPDCEAGAVPPLGQAYGLHVVWDNTLRHADEVYFEGGDHRHLIHIGHDEFMRLMEDADHATISCTPDTVEYYQHMH